MQDIDLRLSEILNENAILKDEPMSKHTSFRIGGNADYFLKVSNIDELKKILKLCKNDNIQYFVIGNGTNLLVDDEGIHGIVIKLEFKNYEIQCENDWCLIKVGAGMSLAELANIALKNEYSGLEFAGGIPGTVGGALRMNAGAFGGEMKDIVVSTKCIDENHEIVELSNEDQKFDYRTSCFAQNNLIILETKIKLFKSCYDDIKQKMDDFRKKRIETQPVNYPSAGSVFKKNKNLATAKMIDECGLKGYRVGGAEISAKHAGFIVNVDNASSKDVLGLIDVIKNEIKNKFNENVELEILLIGGNK